MVRLKRNSPRWLGRYVHDDENSVVLAPSHVVWKVSKVLSKRRWEW
jgi:hypothetical protein